MENLWKIDARSLIKPDLLDSVYEVQIKIRFLDKFSLPENVFIDSKNVSDFVIAISLFENRFNSPKKYLRCQKSKSFPFQKVTAKILQLDFHCAHNFHIPAESLRFLLIVSLAIDLAQEQINFYFSFSPHATPDAKGGHKFRKVNRNCQNVLKSSMHVVH